MKIIVDAFGGDNAPLEIIKGAVMAKNEYNVDIVLVGNEEVIRQVAVDNDIDIYGIEIAHADSVISQEEPGSEIMKSKSDSSMAVGLKMLANKEGDAFVSAGNSGALCVGATLIVKRIKGIKRPGFAAILPNLNGRFMLVDCGANVECKPNMLKQFAIMGSIYMQKVMGIENPRIGLANVGTEEHKGTPLQHETYKLLSNSNLNFVGNVEGRDIPLDGCDVLVADGFTGNLILKTYEGVALAILKKIKGIFTKNIKNKISAALIMKDVKEFKKAFDYSEGGGAPIMGCSMPVFKAHGNSDAKTFKMAIKMAKIYSENDVIGTISQELLKNRESDKEDE